MKMIQNPILRGFNPDPSIVRVGDDYYIATSTFEWFPGVQIHHSRDLIHWRLIAHPLNRVSQLDLKGNAASCGVWAPCLSYDQGLFYLVVTDVKTSKTYAKDTHNYVVTATDIQGDWSEPVYLNSYGFDPSLFHDDDGRHWLVLALTTGKIGIPSAESGYRSICREKDVYWNRGPIYFKERS
jgi:xylan 1,4-beta-xylosidase